MLLWQGAVAREAEYRQSSSQLWSATETGLPLHRGRCHNAFWLRMTRSLFPSFLTMAHIAAAESPKLMASNLRCGKTGSYHHPSLPPGQVHCAERIWAPALQSSFYPLLPQTARCCRASSNISKAYVFACRLCGLDSSAIASACWRSRRRLCC